MEKMIPKGKKVKTMVITSNEVHHTITATRVIQALQNEIRNGYITSESLIVNADYVFPDSHWATQHNVEPGTLLLRIRNPDGDYGTLELHPTEASMYLS